MQLSKDVRSFTFYNLYNLLSNFHFIPRFRYEYDPGAFNTFWLFRLFISRSTTTFSCCWNKSEIPLNHNEDEPSQKEVNIRTLQEEWSLSHFFVSILHLSLSPSSPPSYCQRKQNALRGSLGFWVKVTQTGEICHMERRCPKYSLPFMYTFKMNIDTKNKKMCFKTKN